MLYCEVEIGCTAAVGSVDVLVAIFQCKVVPHAQSVTVASHSTSIKKKPFILS